MGQPWVRSAEGWVSATHIPGWSLPPHGGPQCNSHSEPPPLSPFLHLDTPSSTLTRSLLSHVSFPALLRPRARQCCPAAPGPWRAAGGLEVGGAGQLPGGHATARQGGPGEQGTVLGVSWSLCPSPAPLTVLSLPPSRSTTSASIRARGPPRCCWHPGRPCRACRSRDRGSSSRASSGSPVSPAPVCW